MLLIDKRIYHKKDFSKSSKKLCQSKAKVILFEIEISIEINDQPLSNGIVLVATKEMKLKVKLFVFFLR